MDAYAFEGALYCEDCGREAGGDEGDLFPDGGGESDSPEHCANDDACVNAEIIAGRKIGAFLENPLTREGVRYLCEMASEYGTSRYQRALHKMWINYYRRHGYKNEIAKCIREQVRSR